MSLLGHGDGYLCAAVGLMSADPATADPKRASDAARLRIRDAAGRRRDRRCGLGVPGRGARGRAAAARPDGVVGPQPTAGKANEQLLRQAVLAIRTWQPEVIVTDVTAPTHPADALALHAAKEAFKQAADPNCFPEQITALGLKPWSAKKLYALTAGAKAAPVKLDQTVFQHSAGRLAEGLRRAGHARPGGRLGRRPTAGASRWSRTGSKGPRSTPSLMDGIVLARGGSARRPERQRDDSIRRRRRRRRRQSQARRQLEGLAAIDRPGIRRGGQGARHARQPS